MEKADKADIVEQATIKLLEELTQADGVAGHEDEVRAIFEDRLAGVGEIRRDRIGNITCTRIGNDAGPRVLIDSHLDEVGFIVQRITPAGYVKFVPAGGWWPHTLLAHRVRIGTRNGKVPGVIGAPPPHLLDKASRDKVLEIKDMAIDIGAENARQASEDFGVVPGCPIVPATPFAPMRHPRRFSAKAFDNRVGVACVVESLLALAEHPNVVIGSGCAQEEVGLRGARTLGPGLDADVAIVLEAPPADDGPGADPTAAQGRLGGGVQIRLFDPTMIAAPRLADFVVEIAKTNDIAHQIAVRSSGGTNAGALHQAPGGVPSIVLGVPTRYIHSHASIIDLDDYLAMRELVGKVIGALDADRVRSLA